MGLLRRNKGTRIVIKAFNEKARGVIKESKAVELSKREELKVKKRLSPQEKEWLKTVSVYVPKDNPLEHHILGFTRMNRYQKTTFYNSLKKDFSEAGCGLEDWEVRFYDE